MRARSPRLPSLLLLLAAAACLPAAGGCPDRSEEGLPVAGATFNPTVHLYEAQIGTSRTVDPVFPKIAHWWEEGTSRGRMEVQDRVVHVESADVIHTRGLGPVRVMGMLAPPPSSPEAERARELGEEWLEGEEVRIIIHLDLRAGRVDTDRLNRALGDVRLLRAPDAEEPDEDKPVWPNGPTWRALMLREGLAVIGPDYPFTGFVDGPGDGGEAAEEAEAREAGRGVWAWPEDRLQKLLDAHEGR